MSETAAPYVVRVTTPVVIHPASITDEEMRLIIQVRRLTQSEKPFRLIVESDGRNLHLWEGKRAGVI